MNTQMDHTANFALFLQGKKPQMLVEQNLIAKGVEEMKSFFSNRKMKANDEVTTTLTKTIKKGM